MTKALGALRTGGMAALILAWAVGGEVKLLAIVCWRCSSSII
jgi:hypothetical protein